MCCRAVFPGVPIYICNWHVKRAWIKNLVLHVKDVDTRHAMFARLADIMHSCRADSGEVTMEQVRSMVSKFLEDYAVEASFIGYFTKEWLGGGDLPGEQQPV